MAGPIDPRVRRRIVTVVALIVFGVVVWASRSTAIDAVRALRHADWSWVAAASVAEVVMYLTLGGLLVRLFRHQLALSFPTGTAVALVVYGLGGIMPASPAEGMSAAAVELRRRGVPVGDAARTLVLSEWERFVALAILVAVDQVVAVLNGRPLHLSLPLAVALSALVLVLAGVASRLVRGSGVARAGARIGAWARSRRFARTLPPRGHPFRREPLTVRDLLGERHNRFALLGWSAAGWLADAGCLALCVKAMGDELGLDAVLLAYAIGAAVAIVPLLPGGLGAVEVAVPAVLHRMGLPLDTAVAATILWRGLALIAPALAGSVALVTLRSARTRRETA
ncbi:MAG: lysylphosphatidylglycerol synthase transmembrane domain-containing protein [Acidimicrobiales bacterium]